MANAVSPLRYPGGKTSLTGHVSAILRLNKLQYEHYAEPYAGGCGLALNLLYRGYVSDIHVNDVDRPIWAFWHSILHDTEQFIALMTQTPVTVAEWHRQREIHTHQADHDTLSLGFATFFLNRTNRSGIIKKAGVIGGLQQNGRYKIDCRFNKEGLAQRIRRVAFYKDRIHLYQQDALDFLDHIEQALPEKTFCYLDPPYFKKGPGLYTSFYQEGDHAKVAERTLQLPKPWIVTYDETTEIRRLYRSRRQYLLPLNYSVQEKRLGLELLIASKGLRIPSELRTLQVHHP
jgi:DNA adenine methylase